jgi:dTDP-4-amino-4,6-dideoxygalactose transaminase
MALPGMESHFESTIGMIKPVHAEMTRKLCRMYGYAHAVFLGRARSGLVALIDILGLAGKPIVIPSNICPAVVAAIYSGGGLIRLAPVERASGLAEDENLLQAMKDASDPGMVMPTHLYGFLAQYDQTRSHADRTGWFVLENDTLCAARVDSFGRRQAFGDALLLSFGYAKTASAGGGGALLTDDGALAAELQGLVDSWPAPDESTRLIEENLTMARRYLRRLHRPEMSEQLLAIDSANVRHGFPSQLSPGVVEALDRVEATLARRRDVAEHWARALAPFSAELSTPTAKVAAPWRLILMAATPMLRDRIVRELQAAGYDAGINYPALTESFPMLLAGQEHENADAWSSCVLNLWLDDGYTEERIHAAAGLISKQMTAG